MSIYLAVKSHFNGGGGGGWGCFGLDDPPPTPHNKTLLVVVKKHAITCEGLTIHVTVQCKVFNSHSCSDSQHRSCDSCDSYDSGSCESIPEVVS